MLRFGQVLMPLDVQPLSPTRRAIMLLLMAAVLALSLGFAQELVRRQNALVHGAENLPMPGQIAVEFLAPAGVTALRVYTTLEIDAGKPSATIQLPQGSRGMWAFYVEVDGGDLQTYMMRLLAGVLGKDSTHSLMVIDLGRRMGGFPAEQAEQQVGRGADAQFAIVRLTMVPGHLVAFCLSGDGPLTDADRGYFDAYCAQGIVMQPGRPEKKG